MDWDYITFRSVTLAQRGERVLKQGGVGCVLLRTPRRMEAKGCGYCLRLRRRDMEVGLSLLEAQRVPYSRLYAANADGSVEEVQRDLFG